MRIRVFILVAAGYAAGLPLLSARQSVVFTSPCSCEGNHGVERWAEKTDPSDPPANHAEIRSITPSTMAGWGDAGGGVARNGRKGLETQWFVVTGKLSKIRVEDDGDLHLSLDDLERQGHVVVEIPLGDRWCALRKKVFAWTSAVFPFPAGRSLKLRQTPIVTVTGKAFYDAGHASGGNRRSYDAELAVWEIHPVMEISEAVAMGSIPTVSTPLQTPLPAPDPMPTTTPVATAPMEEFVTITQPVPIRIHYGRTILPPGLKLPVVSRDAVTVHVHYMGETCVIPIGSTDLR